MTFAYGLSPILTSMGAIPAAQNWAKKGENYAAGFVANTPLFELIHSWWRI
jgi:hypothetical protein